MSSLKSLCTFEVFLRCGFGAVACILLHIGEASANQPPSTASAELKGALSNGHYQHHPVVLFSEDPLHYLNRFSALNGRDCRTQLAKSESRDPREGLSSLMQLEEINKALESVIREGLIPNGEAGLKWLEERGLVRASKEKVMDSSGKQTMPFAKVELPFAFTGFFLPNKKNHLSPDTFESVIIFIPGIGFAKSVANSVLEISQIFAKGENENLTRPLNANDGPARVRATAIALDATLNGMQDGAPFVFSSPAGTNAVVRHAHLVTQVLFGPKKTFVAGRSQGGLIAIRYAKSFSDVTGYFALNPSHPDEEIIRQVIRKHEDMDPEVARLTATDMRFHQRAWAAHAAFTADYDIQPQSLVPGLVIISQYDATYPMDLYLPAYQAWAAEQPTDRNLVILKIDDHDLWTRMAGKGLTDAENNALAHRKERFLSHVLRQMVEFIDPLVYSNQGLRVP